MLIDTRIVVPGSFNYTAPANEYNDENLFVIGSPTKRLTLCGSTWPTPRNPRKLRRRRPLSPPTTITTALAATAPSCLRGVGRSVEGRE